MYMNDIEPGDKVKLRYNIGPLKEGSIHTVSSVKLHGYLLDDTRVFVSYTGVEKVEEDE